MESGVESMPGVKDLGGVVIDLQGGNYTITKPIIFPSCAGNVVPAHPRNNSIGDRIQRLEEHHTSCGVRCAPDDP
ncbi:unnamed protein product [Lupinus luteus]|uniref:Uncharacterized protein n=1 Tax=Lupinus luteus TaxID=3873 RepID=A0AAV1VXE0_LUPLU